MSQRVTLEDIAQKTGVSLATVSLALRDKPGITDETRQRVLAAARSLGYRRRAATEARATHGLRQVGVVVKARSGEPPQANPFYGPVIAAIEMTCREQRLNLLYATVPVDVDNHPQDVPRMLTDDHLDGIMLVGAFVDHTIEHLLERRGMPTVLVDAYASGHAYDAVISDNFRGAYEATSYLIRAGHRHIAAVGTLPDGYPSIAERRNGYVQALLDNGLPARYFADSHLEHEEIARAAADLLRSHPQITALFCANDMAAINAMAAARAVGRALPDDLAVIGFDDIDMAQHMLPPLTTMRVDKVSMGRMAVHLLANRAEHPASACVTATLRPILVERESVRPPRA